MTSMPRAKNAGSTQVTVLLPDEWVERVDTMAQRLSEPGEPATRATVLRKIIRRGLEALESEHPAALEAGDKGKRRR
jgi:predicted DNA-binding protein